VKAHELRGQNKQELLGKVRPEQQTPCDRAAVWDPGMNMRGRWQ
jgi:hypothetical protein